MILIADSGSTKTNWCWQEPAGGWAHFTTPGMNPTTTPVSDLQAIVQTLMERLKDLSPCELHFYGAGCGTPESQEKLRGIFFGFFPQTEVHVSTDLLGACRALCGTQSGLVGILGTGSNLCRYDGRTIVQCPPSLGYILGDEGSGNYIGKLLLKDYFRHRMPDDLISLFHDSYSLSYPLVVEQLYQGSCPNRYLAQFALFALNHRDSEYIQQLLTHSFTQYFISQVVPLRETVSATSAAPQQAESLNLAGSVAYGFQAEIRNVAEQFDIPVGTIVKDPVPGLVQFHTSNPANCLVRK